MHANARSAQSTSRTQSAFGVCGAAAEETDAQKQTTRRFARPAAPHRCDTLRLAPPGNSLLEAVPLVAELHLKKGRSYCQNYGMAALAVSGLTLGPAPWLTSQFLEDVRGCSRQAVSPEEEKLLQSEQKAREQKGRREERKRGDEKKRGREKNKCHDGKK